MNEKTCNPLLNGWMKTHMHGEPRAEDQSEAPEHTGHSVRMKIRTAIVRATKGSNGSYDYNRRVPVSRIEGFLFSRIERSMFLESNGSCFYDDRTVPVLRIERFLFLESNGSYFY
jgi:hypothetical protein